MASDPYSETEKVTIIIMWFCSLNLRQFRVWCLSWHCIYKKEYASDLMFTKKQFK